MNDVSERERAYAELGRANEQLRQAQKMEALGRLAGGIAHDFNNVLTVIAGYAFMLEESLDPSDARRADVAEIRIAGERASAMTRQLLAMSRHSMVEPQAIRLDEVVSSFAPMLRRVLGESVELVSIAREVPQVLADRGQLEQVLMNLAVNGRDAMPRGGRLTIETAAADGHVELSVTDSGTGMDANTQERIFDPFFTTKGVGEGTGLGLSIVHGIISQAGGTISVYSEQGHGSTFKIRLPITDQASVETVVAETAAPAKLPKLTVLIVDDSSEICAVAGRILRDEGCTVLEAANARAARDVCVSYDGAIDVAVVDVILPDTRGDELAHQLRELRPSMATILSSGYPSGALTAEGAVPPDLLAKPYGPRELRAAVARAAASRFDGEAIADDAGESVLVYASASAHGPRVLLADDERTIRRSLSAALRMSGCTTVEAADGEDAAAKLRTERFDVVISDVYMPNGGGLDIMRAVRAVDLDVPVILMSGTPDVKSAAAAVEYGAFRYLTKPLDYDSVTKLVKHAARAHALARLRRDAYAVGAPSEPIIERAGLAVRFERALERLWVAYQPIVDARTSALFGVEALVRSDEPSMANPLSILDAATGLDQLPRLGREVRRIAAAGLAAADEQVQLFVNLHPNDLVDIELIAETAPLTQLARRVVLECTERAALRSSRELTARLERLRALGFRLAVDDIGAGYSGLTSFTELTPEFVKIDMTLVRDVHRSHVKRQTIRALCQLCHEVGSLVVGEGVETIDERDCLADLGCDLLQGYMLGRPSRDLPGSVTTLRAVR